MKHTLAIAALLFLLACQTRHEQKPSAEVWVKLDSIAEAASRQKKEARFDSLAAIAQSKPVWGERKTVVGDFDGDGVRDTLYEQYISQLTGQETNKGYDFRGELLEDWKAQMDYWERWVREKNPLVRLVSNSPAIQPFDVKSGDGYLGFLYLKNVKDLNGDRTDEIAYILSDFYPTMDNSCSLATYKSGQWKEVHTWAITESDFFYEPGEPKPDPDFVRKKGGKVYCREWAFNEQTGDSDYKWKRLKINW